MTTRSRSLFAALATASLAAACSDMDAPTHASAEAALASNETTSGPAPAPAKLTALVERINARHAAAGSDLRVDEVWLFTVGLGTDPYRRLRTGSKWAWNTVSYMVDTDDLSRQLDRGVQTAAIARAYQSWNLVENSGIQVVQVPEARGNVDIYDAIVRNAKGECIDVFDERARNYDARTGSFQPAADIVVGGWLPPEYFKDCIGSEFVIAVTWSLSSGDADSDQYVDRLYVEQYYNEGFKWVTSGATFLGEPVDLESIAVHENGHALGLGHFGALTTQGLTLKPSGTVYSPHAVMNPGYLGGDIRSLYDTDIAALRTLYAQE